MSVIIIHNTTPSDTSETVSIKRNIIYYINNKNNSNTQFSIYFHLKLFNFMIIYNLLVIKKAIMKKFQESRYYCHPNHPIEDACLDNQSPFMTSKTHKTLCNLVYQ